MHALLYMSLPKCFFQPTKISREDYREIYGKSKTSNRKNCVRPLKFVSRTLCSVALVSEQRYRFTKIMRHYILIQTL